MLGAQDAYDQVYDEPAAPPRDHARAAGGRGGLRGDAHVRASPRERGHHRAPRAGQGDAGRLRRRRGRQAPRERLLRPPGPRAGPAPGPAAGATSTTSSTASTTPTSTPSTPSSSTASRSTTRTASPTASTSPTPVLAVTTAPVRAPTALAGAVAPSANRHSAVAPGRRIAPGTRRRASAGGPSARRVGPHGPSPGIRALGRRTTAPVRACPDIGGYGGRPPGDMLFAPDKVAVFAIGRIRTACPRVRCRAWRRSRGRRSGCRGPRPACGPGA